MFVDFWILTMNHILNMSNILQLISHFQKLFTHTKFVIFWTFKYSKCKLSVNGKNVIIGAISDTTR